MSAGFDWRTEVGTRADSMHALQIVLNAVPTAWGRKHIITACHEAEAISSQATALLIQVYQLETA